MAGVSLAGLWHPFNLVPDTGDMHAGGCAADTALGIGVSIGRDHAGVGPLLPANSPENFPGFRVSQPRFQHR